MTFKSWVVVDTRTDRVQGMDHDSGGYPFDATYVGSIMHFTKPDDHRMLSWIKTLNWKETIYEVRECWITVAEASK